MISVDVIVPCRNEEKYISDMMESIFNQDFPSEFIKIYVVDGMSTDGTRDILKSIAQTHANVFVLDNPSQTTPHALNIGVKASQSEIVIRMDCHAIYPVNYISYLVGKLTELNADNVGICVETLPADSSSKSQGIALALSSSIGVGASSFRLGVSDLRKVDTVPFGCYKRSVFARIGYFDESLIRNQDDEFNSRLVRHGGVIYLLPGMKIKYFARNSFKNLSKMYFQYGLFKPLSNLKSGRVISVRQFIPSLLIMALVAASLLSFFNFYFGLLFFALAFVYETLVVFYAIKIFFINKKQSIESALYGATAVNVLHFSYGWGFLRGLYSVATGWRGSDVGLSR
ncbi:MAG: glycosyltransferase family 2 protein [Bdellovibrio sp.]